MRVPTDLGPTILSDFRNVPNYTHFFFEVQNFAISETKGRIKNLMAPNDFSGGKPILLLFLANFNFRAVALIVWLLQVFENLKKHAR